MSEPVKTSRAERAAATRARILEAARAEFIAQGYHGTVMTAVAARAGVSVQMLYFAFGAKPKLFLAALEVAVLGEDATPPPMTAGWAAALEAPTATEVVASFIRGVADVFRRAGPLSAVSQVAAELEPEIAAVGAEQERLRADGYREIVRAAAARGRYRPGVDEDAATDVLLSLYSPAMYVELTERRGWSHERVIDWLAETVPGLIVAD